MPYRVRSTDLWHSLPGVVAAYQPIAAPDPFAARQNVAHGGARLGVYTLIPMATPPALSVKGWYFSNFNQHFTSGIIPDANTSAIGRFSNASDLSIFVLGSYNGGNTRFGVGIYVTNKYSYGSFTGGTAPTLSSGVQGITRFGGFKNGISEYTPLSDSWSGTGAALYIGARNRADLGTYDSYMLGYIQSILISSRNLSPAEMWLASRQMAYCEQNPDWNAWARRRRYYYAPSAAAGRVGIYGSRRTVALPGGVSIRGID